MSVPPVVSSQVKPILVLVNIYCFVNMSGGAAGEWLLAGLYVKL